MERTFAALRATLEIAKACEDIELIPEQLNAIAEETKKAKASVTDINEARKATKQ